jgi:putative ABC transport system permease protein
VVSVADGGGETGVGQLPIGVIHLSELQALTGSDGADQADQFLVSAASPAVESKLEGVYPRSMVLSRGEVTAQSMGREVPLAMSLAAVLVALIVGTLFVATTMGLEIAADRRQYALLEALGLPFRSRALVVTSQTLVVTLLGGLVGVGLGAAGIVLTNELAAWQFGTGPIAHFRPILLAYGLGTAGLMGLLAAPYLLWLTARTNLLRELAR